MIGLICWFFDQGSLLHSLLNNSIALQRVLHKTLRYQPPQHSHHNDDRCLLGIISSLLDRVQSPRRSQPRSSYHQRFFWNNFQRNRPVKLHKAKNSGTSSSSSSTVDIYHHHHLLLLYSLRISTCTSLGKLYSYRILSRTAIWRTTLTAALNNSNYFST